MRYSSSRATSKRPGVVLLVVMALLAIFAALGLSFVFYADNEAVASDLNISSISQEQADIDPELLMAYFLGQAIYDTENPYSALRGWSLARSIYGANPSALNFLPYNGVGRQALNYPVKFNEGTLAETTENNYRLINYQLHEGPPNASDPYMNVMRRPEFYGKAGDANHRYVGGANPPWTSYDTNSLFLAQVTARGEVLMPSFVRPWNTVGDSNAQKYATLRPHGFWHPGFLAPLPDSDQGGDVRNLDSGPGTRLGGGGFANNDSIWIDLGFPIMTAPNGKRYRPLFAPLIMDLNNRLNLWAHGNVAGTSNQGFGPPEVNLLHLPGATPAEINPFLTARNASAPGVATGFRAGTFYAPIDADGTNAGAATGPIVLPAAGSYWTFPTFPAGYANASAAEITSANLTLGFNPMLAPMRMSHMEALLRFRGTNSPALTSTLFANMPTMFNNPRARNMVTLRSNHFDRIMTAPFIYDPAANAASYQFVPGVGYPQHTAAIAPPDPAVPGTPPAGSEFTADWRSILAQRLRVNVNRPLTDYPAQDAAGKMDISVAVTLTAFSAAQTERQLLAKDIYDALIRVTGAQDPNSLAVNTPTSPQFQAARWLAQLAVNMVDYLDNDDYVTPFKWYQNTTTVTELEVLYGTELPRLVIHEAYASQDNNPTDPEIVMPPDVNGVPTPKALTTKINVWVELHNPFADSVTRPSGSGYPRDNGSAKLNVAGNPAYRVVIAKNSAPFADQRNTTGDPNYGLVAPATNIWKTSSDWGATAITTEVFPANGNAAGTAQQNQGFYVLGPTLDPTGKAGVAFVPMRDPNLGMMTTHTTADMSVSIADPNGSYPAVTLALQRLANPHIPPLDSPGALLHNPYITVDYIDAVQVWDSRLYDAAGPRNPVPGAVNTFQSFGRKQPFTAYNTSDPTKISQVIAQTPTSPNATQPKHTFYSHNSGRNDPFDWLVHLDRPVVNAVELLHVSGYRPHELTNRFIVNGSKFNHYAPWGNQATLIYRVLDLLGAPSPMAGSIRGGRWPGNVNLNTVMDPEILRALADAGAGGTFTGAEVDLAFQKLIVGRGVSNTNPASGDGKPYRSFAAGDFTDTWSRPDGTGVPIFSLPSAAHPHPYQQSALFQKIFNNITTTSNVFAVWWTVGYFEVLDETVRPAKLGQEIGRIENRHIRHRFFAIVDRSGLELYRTAAAAGVTADPAPQAMACNPALVSTITGGATAWDATKQYATSNITVSAGVAYFCTQAHINKPTTDAAYWQPVLQPGMLLEVDAGTANAEVVVVQAVAGNNITAIFTRNHAAGAPIICRGNPGAQVNYNPRRDSNVVLHMSVIR